MLRVLSPEECIEQDRELLEKIREALAERTDSGHPANAHLSNVLWDIMTLWGDRR